MHYLNGCANIGELSGVANLAPWQPLSQQHSGSVDNVRPQGDRHLPPGAFRSRAHLRHATLTESEAEEDDRSRIIVVVLAVVNATEPVRVIK